MIIILHIYNALIEHLRTHRIHNSIKAIFGIQVQHSRTDTIDTRH